MESKVFEPDWENCEYCYVSYSEYDTGYKEYGCQLISEKYSCYGGNLHLGCPLAFQYTTEVKDIE